MDRVNEFRAPGEMDFVNILHRLAEIEVKVDSILGLLPVVVSAEVGSIAALRPST